MKKIILFLCVTIIGVSQSFSSQNCFIAKENGKVLKREGICTKRYAPCSSFKIPLALMGYDTGILKDELHPEWPFKPGYEAFLESWKDPQNPTSWMKNSCVWYSQVLTPQLGMKRFQEYVKEFNYGNQDLSGDKGQCNGLTNAWLSSSLEISPQEQIVFLEKLLSSKLPVSLHAQTMTRNIVYVEDLSEGWKLYGKTGSGFLLNKDRTKKLEIKHGWFIGWIEKGDRKIIFAHHIVDDKKEDKHAGPRAKEEAKEKLLKLIEEAAVCKK
ncbi:MAG: class D beta-lactamase [Alphaproteobacteria bacterium]|nr:class D beta-lactamase [Alphaproteobacteria bacterium]